MRPHEGDEGRRQGQFVGRQPAGGPGPEADRLQRRVHHAEIRVVDPGPDEADGDQRQHGGAVEDGAEERRARDAAIERQRQHEPDRRRQDERAERPQDVVPEREAGDLVAHEDVDVILEADKGHGRRQPVPVEERDVERLQHRVDEKGRIPDQRRSQEEIGDPGGGNPAPATRAGKGGPPFGQAGHGHALSHAGKLGGRRLAAPPSGRSSREVRTSASPSRPRPWPASARRRRSA